MEKIKFNTNSYLSFEVGDELFAADVSNVINILEMVKITKVPLTPPYLLGVINLRGSVLPLADLRIKLGQPADENNINTCILVLSVVIDNELIQLGGIVDSVYEVMEIEPRDIQPSPSIGNKYRSEFIIGMTKVNEKFIMILDMDLIFSVDDLAQLKHYYKKEEENKETVTA